MFLVLDWTSHIFLFVQRFWFYMLWFSLTCDEFKCVVGGMHQSLAVAINNRLIMLNWIFLVLDWKCHTFLFVQNFRFICFFFSLTCEEFKCIEGAMHKSLDVSINIRLINLNWCSLYYIVKVIPFNLFQDFGLYVFGFINL